MSTVGQLIDLVLNQWLYGTFRTRTNVLANDTGPTDTTLQLKFAPDTIGKGTLLAIDDELMEAIAAPSSDSIQVIRGMRGTAMVPHTAPATVDINPRYPRFLVRQAMLDEICAWPESMFSVQPALDANLDFPQGTIDVSALTTGTVRRVLAVWKQSSAPFSDDRWFPVDFNSAKDARFPGSCDVYFKAPRDCPTSFRVVVGTDYVTDVWDDATDLEADVGLQRSAEDVLQLGAAWRLVTGQEAKRLYTEQQGESRDATEVGPLNIAQFGAQLMQMRDMGLARESKRLKDRYGVGVTG